MKVPIYVIDAFADRRFAGNPAAVCALEEWPATGILQSISFENNLANTAFFVPRGSHFDIRWFTPTAEDIATAAAREVDFVSRFFAPRAGAPEDPVTGSSHCALVPYWAGRLGKSKLRARQISARGGELFCELRGDRVRIAGHAVPYLEGVIHI